MGEEKRLTTRVRDWLFQHRALVLFGAVIATWYLLEKGIDNNCIRSYESTYENKIILECVSPQEGGKLKDASTELYPSFLGYNCVSFQKKFLGITHKYSMTVMPYCQLEPAEVLQKITEEAGIENNFMEF
jgi:hypothetical protein